MRTEANVVKFYKKANTHNIFVPKLKVKVKIWSKISKYVSAITHKVSKQTVGRPEAALLLWFFGDFRCDVLLFMVILDIYQYKNR